jgi:hypothetical protein
MRRLFLFSTMVLLGTLLSSCFFMGPSVKGNGEVRSEERKVEDFSGVSVTSGMNVELIQGETQGVRVVADANLHKLIETRVENGVLEIRALANIWKANEKKVVVTVKDLKEISGTAGSNITTGNKLVAGELEIHGSAGSNLRLEIDGQLVDLTASSGANIRLDGTTRELKVKTSSGANIKAGGFLTSACEANASSGGNMWVAVQNELSADASSGGNIFYQGTPSEININTSSGGNIIKK